MSRRNLAGARLVVTGASSGIGGALARALAAAGAELLLVARRADRLTELCQELAGQGARADYLAGDVTDATLRAEAVAWIARQWGALDGLVNNAGIGAIGPLAAAEPARLRRIMEVNFFAPVEWSRDCLPWLERGRHPILVNVGSVLGHRGVPFKTEYCASKFALHGWSDAWRAELAQQGIDLLLVSPSTTASEFFEQALAGQAPPGRRRGMSPETVARHTVNAMRRGRHEIILSWGGLGLVWLDRLFPTVTNRILAYFARRPS